MHMLKQEVADKMRELITPMDVQRIVEIGTGWGESAKFFSELKPNAVIYTIDGFGLYGDGRIYSEFNHEAVKKINEGLGKNVIQILGDSSKIPWELPINVLLLDGNHTEVGCLADFFRYHPFVKGGGYIIFDDYNQPNNPNNGVKKVVNDILAEYHYYKLVYEGYYCAILKKIKNYKCSTIQNY